MRISGFIAGSAPSIWADRRSPQGQADARGPAMRRDWLPTVLKPSPGLGGRFAGAARGGAGRGPRPPGGGSRRGAGAARDCEAGGAGSSPRGSGAAPLPQAPPGGARGKPAARRRLAASLRP